MAAGEATAVSDIERAAVQILCLRKVETELSLGVEEINNRMTTEEIKAALSNVPGIDQLEAERQPGRLILKTPFTHVVLNSDATMDQIGAALTPRTVVPPNHLIPPKVNSMGITGLQSGAFEAKLAAMKERLQAKQNEGLTRVDAKVTAGEQQIDQAISGVEAKMQKEIDDQLAEFAKFTNGGPA